MTELLFTVAAFTILICVCVVVFYHHQHSEYTLKARKRKRDQKERVERISYNLCICRCLAPGCYEYCYYNLPHSAPHACTVRHKAAAQAVVDRSLGLKRTY